MSGCRSCGAEIVWAITTSGKRMPIDAAPVPNGNVTLRDDGGDAPTALVGKGGTHVSHYATCSEAKQWRKPR